MGSFFDPSEDWSEQQVRTIERLIAKKIQPLENRIQHLETVLEEKNNGIVNQQKIRIEELERECEQLRYTLQQKEFFENCVSEEFLKVLQNLLGYLLSDYYQEDEVKLELDNAKEDIKDLKKILEENGLSIVTEFNSGYFSTINDNTVEKKTLYRPAFIRERKLIQRGAYYIPHEQDEDIADSSIISQDENTIQNTVSTESTTKKQNFITFSDETNN